MTARRPREQWSARVSTAASLAISASWHFMLLAVLALAVHPLRFPHDAPAVTVELLPPLVSPPPPPVPVEPEPLPPQPAEALPTPVPPAPVEAARPPPVPPRQVEVERPPEPVLSKPVQVARPLSAAQPKFLQTQRLPEVVAAAPVEAPPVAQPALPKPIEVEPPKSVAAPQSSAVPVLTNDRVTVAPIEIRPPDRPPAPAAAAGGASPGAGSPPPGGAEGGAKPPGAPASAPGAFGAMGNTRFGPGLRMRLGCLNPDTYHLTADERAECLRRLAAAARDTAPMGINIAPEKQAEYDRQRACHNANIGAGMPAGTSESSTGIRGLGDNPRLRDCGPGDR
jgi:hypothetical protein